MPDRSFSARMRGMRYSTVTAYHEGYIGTAPSGFLRVEFPKVANPDIIRAVFYLRLYVCQR